MPKVAPTGHSQNVGLQYKLRMCYYAGDKRCAAYSLKKRHKLLAAGLPSDSLALHRPQLDLRGKGKDNGREGENKEGTGGKGTGEGDERGEGEEVGK